MEIKIKDATLSFVKGDITRQSTDAIVNAANSSMMGGGGVDGAIHKAGGPVILEECRKIVLSQGRLPPGRAVITNAGNLPSKYVIHTVGPVWLGGEHNEADILKSAYLESLRLAESKQLSSVSFPSISTGAYGYPLEEAAKIAVDTVIDFLNTEASSVKEVIFVLFDDVTFKAFHKSLESWEVH
jgi:O-acetyl-ADP-ribose deacetylase